VKTIKIDKYFKGMIAHRGLSGIETENTVFSYLAAANHTYTGISCDLYTSKDGRLILTAESSLLKYGLLNLDIQSFDYEELVKYSLVDRKINNLNRYLYVPLLRDLLSIGKAYEKKIIIHLHPSLTTVDLNNMLRVIHDGYLLEQCFFVSKKTNQIEYLLDSVQSNHIFLDHGDKESQYYEFMNMHKVNAYLQKDLINKDYIKKCHLIGLKVMTGIVNEKEQAERLVKLDIDYMLTDILE